MSFGNVIFDGVLFFQGGLATVVNGSAIVTGGLNAAAGTVPAWLSAALDGDTIAIGSTRHYVKQVVSDTQIVLTEPWSGPSATAVAYTGARNPWHLTDRALAYKFARFLEGDATSSGTAIQAATDALAARADAIAARDTASAWATRPANTDVTTPGTRSALHWSSSASAFATAAGLSAGAAAGSAQLSADWAQKPADTDVTTAGTRSALHWAGKAAGDAAMAAADKGVVAGERATVITARDVAIGARDLAQEWAEKPYGVAVTGTTTGRSAKHYATDAASSAAAAAAIVFAAQGSIDYGFITDLPTDYADYGMLS